MVNMKIGDKVKVIATDEIWGDFFNKTGTIINEHTTVIGIHKFIVEFDEPYYDNDESEGFETFGGIDIYDFPDNCLELV